MISTCYNHSISNTEHWIGDFLIKHFFRMLLIYAVVDLWIFMTVFSPVRLSCHRSFIINECCFVILSVCTQSGIETFSVCMVDFEYDVCTLDFEVLLVT